MQGCDCDTSWDAPTPHRHFTLRSIKVRLTPVSCKLKNPLQSKTAKCFQIIHKVERQLLYDRVSRINNLLEKLEKHQFTNYTCLREIIMKDDLFTCIRFISKIKEHRHIKTKSRQIDKFKRLLVKSGYHHKQQPNLHRCTPLNSILNNTTCVILPANNSGEEQTTTTTGDSTANISTTTTTNNSTSKPINNNPATPPVSSNKWVINLSSKPVTPVQFSLLSRGSNFAIAPRHPLRKHTLQPGRKHVQNSP